MSVAVLRPSDLGALSLRTLETLALATAADVDSGLDRQSVLERIMRVIAGKGADRAEKI